MQTRCRRSLIWMVPLLVTALVGWGGARRAAAATDAPDLSWLEEPACADGVDVAALDAPDWMADAAATAATPAKPAPPDGGKSCTANAQCKAKHYCAKGVGDCKGKGECTAKPTICPLIFKPVCGCDNKTYSNSCFAAVAGVNVKSEGACPKPGGGNYTCKTNKDCPKGDFCSKDIGKCDDEGVCARRPICTALVVAPVCGCNNKTYSNQCIAHSGGENVKHDGKCEK